MCVTVYVNTELHLLPLDKNHSLEATVEGGDNRSTLSGEMGILWARFFHASIQHLLGFLLQFLGIFNLLKCRCFIQ